MQHRAARPGAGPVDDLATRWVDGEEMHEGVLELPADQPHDLAEQLVQIEDGDDGTAGLGDGRELVSAAAQGTVQPGILHGDRDAIGQGPQHQQISLVEVVRLITLHIEDPQDAVLDLER